MAAETLGLAANVIAVIQLSHEVIKIGVSYGIKVKESKDEIIQLQRGVTQLWEASQSIDKLLRGPGRPKLEALHSLNDAFVSAQILLKDLQRRLNNTASFSLWGRLMWPFKRSEVHSISQEIDRILQALSLAFDVDQTNILLNVDQKLVLERLAIADGAAFDSHDEDRDLNQYCLPGTRVELLENISAWTVDSSAKSVFWLNGMAGTGKSTISRTVARSLQQQGNLGASFFFKKGRGDRATLKRFFTTLAAQLLLFEPELAGHIRDCLEEEPRIHEKAILRQFEELILKPLSKLTTAMLVVIVVDALDECEDAEIRQAIGLFARSIELQNISLKFFLTSRPDVIPRLGFLSILGKHDQIVLHEVPESVISEDIRVFIDYQMKEIRSDYNKLLSSDDEESLRLNWPGQADIESLIKMAVPLFIFAATVCRFIKEGVTIGSPTDNLQQVLSYRDEHRFSQMHATYLPVLNQQFPSMTADPQTRAAIIHDFQVIVGAIITLAIPMTKNHLAQLLNISKRRIHDRTKMLHSILRVSALPHVPITLLHLSLQDFLFGYREGNLFWMDSKQQHADIFRHCIRVMRKKLREDMCSLKWPGTSIWDVEASSIAEEFPPVLRYACVYWADHFCQSNITDASEVLDFIQQHLLHWFEAMCLLDQFNECLALLPRLRRNVSVNPHKATCLFLEDAIKLTRANYAVMGSFPLQIYSSALSFAPADSVVRATFDAGIPQWIKYSTISMSAWDDECLHTLEGHGGWVDQISFSPDGRLLASTGQAKVLVWSTRTGQCVFEMSTEEIEPSIAFSHDSSNLAVLTKAGIIELRHIETGLLIITLGYKRSEHGMEGIIFSPDSSRLAANFPEKVIVWTLGRDKRCQAFQEEDGLCSVCFSIDNTYLACGRNDGTVGIWHIESGARIRVLGQAMRAGEQTAAHGVLFSIEILASLFKVDGSDWALRIYSIDEGATLHDDFVIFTDSYTIASEFDLEVAFIRNTLVKAIQVPGHQGRLEVGQLPPTVATFSPDGHIIATRDRGAVRLFKFPMPTHSAQHDHDKWLPRTSVLLHSNRLYCLVWDDDSNICFRHKYGTLPFSSSDDGSVLKELKILELSTDKTWAASFGGPASCVVEIWKMKAEPDMLIKLPNGRIYAVFGDYDGGIRVQEYDSPARMQTLTPPSELDQIPMDEYGAGIRCIASANDSQTIAALYGIISDNFVLVWNVITGTRIRQVRLTEYEILCPVVAAFLSDARFLAFSCYWNDLDNEERLFVVDLEAANTSLLTCYLPFNDVCKCLEICQKGDESRIKIGDGTYDVGYLEDAMDPALRSLQFLGQDGLGLDDGHAWVTWNGRKLLYIPFDLRPQTPWSHLWPYYILTEDGVLIWLAGDEMMRIEIAIEHLPPC